MPQGYDGKAPECMPVDEDDTVENVVADVSSAGCSNNGADTVYAPIRAFVPKRFWQHCSDAFLNSAVVSTQAEDDRLQSCYPNTFHKTFLIPPCERRSDYRSTNSVVNSLHANVPVQIFEAMMAAGITDVLENKSLDASSDKFWDEVSSTSDVEC